MCVVLCGDLVKSDEAEALHDGQGADSGPGGDLSCHLQTDLHDLQRVGEDHLGTAGLGEHTGRGD